MWYDCNHSYTVSQRGRREGSVGERHRTYRGKVDTSYYYVYGQHCPHNVMIYGFDSFSIFSVLFCTRFSRHLAVRFGSSILQNLTLLWIHAVWLAKTERGVKRWCSLCFTFSPLWLLFVFIPKFLQFFFNMSLMTAGIWRNIIFWNALLEQLVLRGNVSHFKKETGL